MPNKSDPTGGDELLVEVWKMVRLAGDIRQRLADRDDAAQSIADDIEQLSFLLGRSLADPGEHSGQHPGPVYPSAVREATPIRPFRGLSIL